MTGCAVYKEPYVQLVVSYTWRRQGPYSKLSIGNYRRQVRYGVDRLTDRMPLNQWLNCPATGGDP